ncbi:hypothetical protein Lgee_1904 [Legionella geestiana]|uniref:Uncharacterized protein n=1 Tax=Legionella geestiana TaxID=45065 RepID=A0A0W0TNS1_9GAMM|nr:hypothetical protein [Legionella geestiana]KTC97243.1 hypothetical protein Lgee_1904 [Legionella geestiana]QBS12375.1 hypothetical protein E4T54_06235 [Legionella geestiana]QDQ39912.1 hypothetical protein E3226_005625 [Legionella geestiana]STX55186.1 Uncharacterised protein [Legionella geestiana]
MSESDFWRAGYRSTAHNRKAMRGNATAGLVTEFGNNPLDPPTVLLSKIPQAGISLFTAAFGDVKPVERVIQGGIGMVSCLQIVCAILMFVMQESCENRIFWVCVLAELLRYISPGLVILAGLPAELAKEKSGSGDEHALENPISNTPSAGALPQDNDNSDEEMGINPAI